MYRLHNRVCEVCTNAQKSRVFSNSHIGLKRVRLRFNAFEGGNDTSIIFCSRHRLNAILCMVHNAAMPVLCASCIKRETMHIVMNILNTPDSKIEVDILSLASVNRGGVTWLEKCMS